MNLDVRREELQKKLALRREEVEKAKQVSLEEARKGLEEARKAIPSGTDSPQRRSLMGMAGHSYTPKYQEQGLPIADIYKDPGIWIYMDEGCNSNCHGSSSLEAAPAPPLPPFS